MLRFTYFLAFMQFFAYLCKIKSRTMAEHLSKAQIKWIRSLQQKKNRDAEGVFVAEGEKCVNDLRNAFELVLLASPENASRTEIEHMSSLRNPQGTIAVFRKPTSDTQYPTSDLLLALDGIQDPGNLGTIIRTCDWFGIRNILCSCDTADCYNPKVVQATMGALARVKLHYVDLPKVLSEIKTQGTHLYGTLLEGTNMYQPQAIPDKQHGVIIMGNEGNGISPAVRSLITHPLLIPSYPADAATSESLNVGIATAIVLAEFRRH
jgi:TrmH family RNA methyltransferase